MWAVSSTFHHAKTRSDNVQDPRDVQKGSDDDSSEEESDSSEEESDDEPQGNESMTREERRAAAKARKEAAKKKQTAAQPGDLPPTDSEEEDDAPANPNHTSKSKAQAQTLPQAQTAGPSKVTKPVGELSRREREALQAQQSRERYQKLHAEGKTDEARADMARLKLIREQRDAAAARKQAEKEERDAAEERRLAEMDDKERKKREAALGPAAKKGGKKSTKS